VEETHSSVALVFWLKTVLLCFVIMDHKRRLICLYLLYRRRQRKSRKCRKYWVHLLLTQRDKVGAFQTLYEKLKNEEKKYFNYFRMSLSTFEQLLQRLHNSLLRQNTKMRSCISPSEMLAVTIR
jgi:hypothetical protein